MEKCPVSVDVRAVMDLIVKGDYLGAAAKVREDNALPAITGRVCPVEDQCESGCVLGKKGEPVGIAYLERFVADWERESGTVRIAEAGAATRQEGWPSSAAARRAWPAPATSSRWDTRCTCSRRCTNWAECWCMAFRNFACRRTSWRTKWKRCAGSGVVFETNVVVGKTVTIDELLQEEGYDAVFVATGAGLPRFLNVPGEHFNGIYSANEFLTRVNLMRAYRFPEFDEPLYPCKDRDVVVIGGGNTAMDAVRSALRLGAKSASILYRRTEAEMPARVEEVHHAKDEGVHFEMLVNPVEFLGDEKGNLTAVRCTRMELGEPDDSGRRSPVTDQGLGVRYAVLGGDHCGRNHGEPADPVIDSGTAVTKRGYIAANDDTLATSKPGVFAGGDIVTGGATVILAMGAGRKAAKSINEYLKSLDGAAGRDSNGRGELTTPLSYVAVCGCDS